MARRKGPNEVQRWLVESDSLLAAIARFVLALVLALLSPVLIPVVWAIALAVQAYHALRDRYARRYIRRGR